MAFRDRVDGGRCLAQRVEELELASPVVLGLPVGGIVVAAEVAAVLGVPFDVFVATGVVLPGGGDFGIGAVAEGLPEPVVSETSRLLGVGPRDLGILAEQARGEIRRQVLRYRGGRTLPDVSGRNVVLVDDGSASAVTAEAALRALRYRRPTHLVLAAPVCSRAAASRAGDIADDVICTEVPVAVFASRHWYDDDATEPDQAVLALLGSRFATARSTRDLRRRASAS